MDRAHPYFVNGLLLGGAVGDALGAPVEFMSWSQIREAYGESGIRDFAPCYGKLGAITDDTQMTLFTLEGVIDYLERRSRGEEAIWCRELRSAYDRWMMTQGEAVPGARQGTEFGWLLSLDQLHARRAPGNTCLGALRQRQGDGYQAKNQSKGCGGVMRVAPVGLLDADVFQLASDAAAITHGHPLGTEASGALAFLINRVLYNDELHLAVAKTLERASDTHGLRRCLAHAFDLAGSDIQPRRAIASIGEGWVAEEALAISIYCALKGESFEESVVLAVNHSGDSDSTGSITGQILGLREGVGAIPARWLANLELREAIFDSGERLHRALYDNSRCNGSSI